MWDYRAKVPLMCSFFPSIFAQYSYIRTKNIMSGLFTAKREVPRHIKHDLSLSTWMVMFGYDIFYANPYSPYTTGHTQAHCGDNKLWGKFWWMSRGPMVVVKQTMGAMDYLNFIEDNLYFCMLSIFFNVNRVFTKENAPCHTTLNVLEWFQEHNTKFYLTSWSLNSMDVNPTNYNHGVIQRLSRVKKQPFWNILYMLDRCLNNEYNL